MQSPLPILDILPDTDGCLSLGLDFPLRVQNLNKHENGILQVLSGTLPSSDTQA